MTLTKKKNLKKPTNVKNTMKKPLLSKSQLDQVFDNLPKSKQMKMFPDLPVEMQITMFPTLPPETQSKLLPSLPNLVQTKLFPTLPPETQSKLLPTSIVFQDHNEINKKQDDLLQNINHVTNTLNVFYGAHDFSVHNCPHDQL